MTERPERPSKRIHTYRTRLRPLNAFIFLFVRSWRRSRSRSNIDRTKRFIKCTSLVAGRTPSSLLSSHINFISLIPTQSVLSPVATTIFSLPCCGCCCCCFFVIIFAIFFLSVLLVRSYYRQYGMQLIDRPSLLLSFHLLIIR